MSYKSCSITIDTTTLIKNNFSPQIILPELAQAIGLEESIVLNQLHYWLQRSQHIINGQAWVYNTFEQWQEQFTYWSLSKIKRIFASLHKTGLIISQKKKRYSGCHTKWYSIDYHKFFDLLDKIKPAQQHNNKKFSDTQFFAHHIANNNVEHEAIPPISSSTIIADIIEIAAGQGEDNFALAQNELSSGQFDTIITDSNLTDNINCMSNDIATHKKSAWLDTLRATRQTFSFSNKDLQLTDQLMQIWSEVFIHEQKNIFLHDKRRAKLLQAWHQHFAADFGKWREFCLGINSSKFLMGEKKTGFKAHFDWLLEEKTIVKIRAGEFDIGDRIPDIKQEHYAREKAQVEALAVAKLAALQAEKQKAEHEAEIKCLAAKLEWSALEKIENSWTYQEIEQAKQEFEQCLFAEEDKYGLHHYRDIFKQGRWQEPMINFAFTSFKRQRYLTKTADQFLIEAKNKFLEEGLTSTRFY